jgi:hypothetical protein
MRRYLTTFVMMVFVYSAALTHLRAQVTAGLLGTVTDTSGAAIPDAAILVTNAGTGIAQTVQSDAQGRYRVTDLAIGDYSIQTSKGGFSTVVRNGITLNVGSLPVIDFQMQVGQQATTISVESEVSQVDTQSTAVAVLVESKVVHDLPLNGRNYTQLIALSPGVAPLPQGAVGGPSTFFGNGVKYTIAGGRPQGQDFLLDGQDLVGFWNQGPGAQGLGTALGIEAIAEFQTLTNTYSPQFGGAGSVVNAASKSGANAIHGSAYEFLRNNVMEARNFFDNVIKPGATSASPPVFRRNQFGGSLGGPIKKDKAFYFVNYEGLRSTQVTSNIVVVPDACVHNAIINSTPGIATATTGCPVTATTSANVAAATSVRNIMAIYPLPNYAPDIGSGTGQALVSDPVIGYENYLVTRGDYRLSDKDSFFIRYVLDRASRNATAGIPYWGELDLTRDHFATIGETHIFSSSLLNVVHFSYGRSNESAYGYGSPTVANGVVAQGTLATPVTSSGTSSGVHPLQFFSSDPTSLYYAVTTAGLSIPRNDGAIAAGSGITSIGGSTSLPFFLVPNKFQLTDDITWTRGAHSVTAGASAMRVLDETYEPYQDGPQWVFANLSSFISGSASTVTGAVSDNQNPGGVDEAKDYLYWVFGFYVNDQWKATRKLTVNAGVRYSPETNIGLVLHKAYNIINMPYGLWVPVTQDFATNPSLHNWDPRIGLAYDPFSDHKTSIRASFGMFHSVIFARDTLMTIGPPWLTVSQSTSSSVPIQFPLPYSNVPFGTGTVIPTDGTLTATNYTWYQRKTTPYQMQFNLNIEREMLRNTLFSIGYLGSSGVHLPLTNDANYVTPRLGPNGLPIFGVFNGTNAVVANPRLNPQYSQITQINSVSSSHYESLQAGMTHRFSGGWQAQASYSWSKSIDDTSGSYSADGGGGISNPTNQAADHGLSSFNRAQNFHLSGLYNLPVAAHGFVGQVINGWQLTGIFTYLSGAPANIGTIATRADNSVGASGAKPNAVANCNLYTGITPEQAASGQSWYNAACFTPAPLGVYGNAGRNTIIGPDIWGLDDSITKDWKVTKISERFTVQFRAEAFNILNHPTFQNPNVTPFNSALSAAVNAANSGGCTAAAGNLASCGVSVNGSSGRITATNSSPRQIQLVLRITF